MEKKSKFLWMKYEIANNRPIISFFLAVCIGTNGRMSVPNNREHHYRNLRDRYSNCTYVDGNLELTWLQVILKFLACPLSLGNCSLGFVTDS